MLELNKIYCAEASEFMKKYIPDSYIDLTVTSPPYDDLRIYNGYVFNFEAIANELYRITKDGGVVVWIVGDKTVNGNETGTSFRQALYFKEIGFKLHDTMIYAKKNTPFMRSNAYTPSFEYMFVFVKGKLKTFNPIKEPTVRSGFEVTRSNKGRDGNSKKVVKELKKEKTKTNIWYYAVGLGGSTRDKIAFNHPAIFPEKLAEDHILSWSNEGDIVLDPMCGSGTTCKMALLNNRKFIGIDISQEYVDLANERIHNYKTV